MNHPHRYAPPGAPVDAAAIADSPARRVKFPWLLVLRTVAGALLLLDGAYALYRLSQVWSVLADRAFIDPLLTPWRFLVLDGLKTATGLALLARSRFSLVLTLVWIGGFLGVTLAYGVHRLPGSNFFLMLGVAIALLAFQCLLLSRRMLR